MNQVIDRLVQERKIWRQNTPNGFLANPRKNVDGSLNLFVWDCEIPGPRKTPWNGKSYKFKIEFNKTDLNQPLLIHCISKVFHPNVDYKGFLCSDLTSFWPNCHLKQILFGLQSFLEYPTIEEFVLNYEAARLFKEDRQKYNERVQNTQGEYYMKI